MQDTVLENLTDEALVLINELKEIIPNWQKVNLTKIGYNEQYVQTLLSVAIFVLEREKKVIERLQK